MGKHGNYNRAREKQTVLKSFSMLPRQIGQPVVNGEPLREPKHSSQWDGLKGTSLGFGEVKRWRENLREAGYDTRDFAMPFPQQLGRVKVLAAIGKAWKVHGSPLQGLTEIQKTKVLEQRQRTELRQVQSLTKVKKEKKREGMTAEELTALWDRPSSGVSDSWRK
jgi:hypothetical protein